MMMAEEEENKEEKERHSITRSTTITSQLKRSFNKTSKNFGES